MMNVKRGHKPERSTDMMEMKVTALAWVAMMESAMAYQGMVRPASR